MKKIMAVVTAEPIFSQRFSDYVNGSGASALRARAFPHVEDFLRCRKENGPGSVPVLLCDEELFAESRGFDFSGTEVFLLSETGKDGTLSKYQSGPALLSAVLTGCADRRIPAQAPEMRKDLEIHAVWGPGNGLSRIWFSLALTRMLSRRKKAVYMDFHEFSGLRSVTGKTCERGLSTAFYYLKQGTLDGQRLMGLLEDHEGISYLPPFSSSEDAGVMGMAERNELFRMLAEGSPVEAVVADLSDPMAASADLLEICEKVYLIGSSDPAEREAAAAFTEMVKAEGREDLLERIVKVEPEGMPDAISRSGIDGVIYSETGDHIRRMLES